MSFELTVAVKRDPLETRAGNASNAASASHAEITLNGTFGPDASRDVLLAISTVARDGADSILVDMDDVVSDDRACLEAFAVGLMSLRQEGVQVQLTVRGAALHEELRQLPQSRDWLVAYSENPVGGARRSLHLDGPV
jgi:anti-anti-sigma regulatory factor